jgi:exodeoxyribonuclease VII large subunit
MSDAPATMEAPWPVALLGTKLRDYIDRLGTVWVEGEITQWGASGGNVYGKLKDLEIDATVGFTIWSSVRAKIPADLNAGHGDEARRHRRPPRATRTTPSAARR